MKTTMRAVLLLLSSLLAAAASSSHEDRCHPDDKAALLAIKAALRNPHGFASWTSNSSCCDWYEVDCDIFTGRVTHLTVVEDDTVAGAIPDAVGDLAHLEYLDLSHLKALSGPIPPAIARLSNLSMLTISWTAVSGPVPAFLSELAALTDLDLSHNSLAGSIPPSLALLPNLVSLDLRHNRLTGPLPPLLFSRAPQGEEGEAHLTLSRNNLTGGIPAEWSAVRFQEIDLSENSLTGDASPLFGAVKPLRYLDLYRNGFSFNFSGVELPEERLSYFDVSHNAIYGGIPAQAANLTDLYIFDVSYNQLCGEVPKNMASLDAGMFEHNKCLCGSPLPPCRSEIE
ncbi:hypothetical protein ACP70R_031892 [Stipagrostis hirtigluma subsp. patula]